MGGNILLHPGVSAKISVFFGPSGVQASRAVRAIGSAAVAVGEFLKAAVDSAVARAAVV
jgi:hypothetical protein